MTASLQCTTGCAAGTTQTWALSMSDETAGLDLERDVPISNRYGIG